MVSSCCYQLRRIKSIRLLLPKSTAGQLVNSFIILRVDYCNSTLAGMSACQISLIQAILNSAAQLIYGRSRYDHVTDLIRDKLHWLPIQHRVGFKCAMLVYRALHGIASSYIARFCVKQPVVERRYELRSAAPWLFQQWKLIFSSLEDASSLSPVHRPGTLCRTSSRMPSHWINLKPGSRRILISTNLTVSDIWLLKHPWLEFKFCAWHYKNYPVNNITIIICLPCHLLNRDSHDVSHQRSTFVYQLWALSVLLSLDISAGFDMLDHIKLLIWMQ